MFGCKLFHMFGCKVNNCYMHTTFPYVWLHMIPSLGSSFSTEATKHMVFFCSKFSPNSTKQYTVATKHVVFYPAPLAAHLGKRTKPTPVLHSVSLPPALSRPPFPASAPCRHSRVAAPGPAPPSHPRTTPAPPPAASRWASSSARGAAPPSAVWAIVRSVTTVNELAGPGICTPSCSRLTPHGRRGGKKKKESIERGGAEGARRGREAEEALLRVLHG